MISYSIHEVIPLPHQTRRHYRDYRVCLLLIGPAWESPAYLQLSHIYLSTALLHRSISFVGQDGSDFGSDILRLIFGLDSGTRSER